MKTHPVLQLTGQVDLFVGQFTILTCVTYEQASVI